ncbi:MAG: twin-arginine translocase subunit TatB [Proteobacteria bacterium]|nr:twin-arginine translocase subunit TatB [Pseudomonadota bacterium]
MFDIGWDEMLFTAIVAIVVIGPKDMPRALRTAGQWIGKMRRVSGHFRAGIETMIREAELEEMEKEWREKNAAIMAQHPVGSAHAEAALEGADPGLNGTEMEPGAAEPPLKDAPPLPVEVAMPDQPSTPPKAE